LKDRKSGLNEKKVIEPAGIEYAGQPGVSKECQDAVLRLIQFGDRITHASILTSSNEHALLLKVNSGDLVAVKSGFASGYLGEGPRTLSYVLQVLDALGTDIEEYSVSPDLIDRIDTSSLTISDLDYLNSAKRLRPHRWYDYVLEKHYEWRDEGTLWKHEFPLVIPFAVIDSRIIDFALSFWDEPDDKLMKAYRRLEDIVRERTAIDEHGAKLFSQAFAAESGRLYWKNIGSSEHNGRVLLFTGAYMAYRNRRAHRESREGGEYLLAEFLLLNHLYRVEKTAIKRRRRSRPKHDRTEPVSR
jgi:hypothetical protein